jgi:hypothetical protein
MGSGGGYNSKQVKKVGVKSGAPSTNKISPRGVSQFGYATGGRLRREGSFTGDSTSLPVNAGVMPQVPMGNKVALNVGKGGPGAGRSVMARGSQGVHGNVAGPAPVQGRDILGAFGPEANPSSLVRRR